MLGFPSFALVGLLEVVIPSLVPSLTRVTLSFYSLAKHEDEHEYRYGNRETNMKIKLDDRGGDGDEDGSALSADVRRVFFQ